MRISKILFLALVAVCMSACVRNDDDTPSEEYVHKGDLLPVFVADGPSGTSYHSADARGKITIICLFNTTCPDCHRELPKLQYVWQELDGESFELACIGRERTLAEIAEFWEEQGFTMPYYEDPLKTVYGLFATRTIPRIYLTDKAGIVREMWVENTDMTREQLLAIVRGYLETP